MISTIRCGKTFLFSILMLILASCFASGDKESFDAESNKSIEDIFMKSYKEKELQFTLTADRGFSHDSTEDILLFNPVYRRAAGDSVVIEADSCLSGKDRIVYYGNVKVAFEDSMVLYTDSLAYFIETDSSMTEDSVLIEKNSNKMKSKGFAGSSGFKKIKFLDRVVLYDE